jgi:hypothetical protein
MNAAAGKHVGLPFVLTPAPEELLGSWLLRMAELYGVGLAPLLSRLAVRPSTTKPMPHWFALRSDSVSLDALSAATRLAPSGLAAMAPIACAPRWPQELGACARCLARAADADQPVTWSRNWMSPLAIVCGTHGDWLTPVATGTLIRVRHASDLAGVADSVAATPALLDDGHPRTLDALWLQELCAEQGIVQMPCGKAGPHDLIRIVAAVAREVISASNPHDCDAKPTAGHRKFVHKDYAFETAGGQRTHMTLPTQLRDRQWVLGKVAHVLRTAADVRRPNYSWSSASVQRLASMQAWPDGVLDWVCAKAAELARRDEALRRELSISPRYFKAHSALIASIQ